MCSAKRSILSIAGVSCQAARIRCGAGCQPTPTRERPGNNQSPPAHGYASDGHGDDVGPRADGNQAVFAFRRREDASLRYTGIESHKGLTDYGLYDNVVARE
jgi:hypothetical protein